VALNGCHTSSTCMEYFLHFSEIVIPSLSNWGGSSNLWKEPKPVDLLLNFVKVLCFMTCPFRRTTR
jgi:hypothetical protein